MFRFASFVLVFFALMSTSAQAASRFENLRAAYASSAASPSGREGPIQPRVSNSPSCARSVIRARSVDGCGNARAVSRIVRRR